MKCETCKRDGEVFVEYTQISFCKTCYELFLFKRLKKWFRSNKVIDKSKIHVLLDDDSVGFLFLKKFFEKFFSYPGLKWVVRKRITSRMKNKVVIIPTSLTQETDAFIYAVFNDLNYVFGKNVFMPLTCFLETDLSKWKRKKRTNPVFEDVHFFVEEIVKRRPMARFSILKHLQKF
ncbi:MAG: hypothetical protein GON13_01810 [Nanoarchaeota archaeon]|nr:hypothetical protein [Nanoarchaeota archaeon]